MCMYISSLMSSRSHLFNIVCHDYLKGKYIYLRVGDVLTEASIKLMTDPQTKSVYCPFGASSIPNSLQMKPVFCACTTLQLIYLWIVFLIEAHTHHYYFGSLTHSRHADDLIISYLTFESLSLSSFLPISWAPTKGRSCHWEVSVLEINFMEQFRKFIFRE